MSKKVIVIGGGFAGLIAARALQSKHQVIVLEKARGPGGRMATRSIPYDQPEFRFDYGVRQFDTSHEIFTEICSAWMFKDLLSEAGEKSFQTKQGLNLLPKFLAKDVEIRPQHKVLSISKEDQKLRLQIENQNSMDCDALFISAPAPQALDLLKGLEIEQDYCNELKKLKYQPRWVFTIEDLSQRQPLPLHSPDFRFYRDHYAKKSSISIYLSSARSEKMMEVEKESAFDLIKEEIANLLQVPASQLKLLHAHKWRYSQSIDNLTLSHLEVLSEPSIYLIGDYFHGSSVESSYLSAMSASQAFLDSQQS